MIESFRRSYPVYVFIDLCLVGLSFAIVYFSNFINVSSPGLVFDTTNLNKYIFIFTIWAFFIVIAFAKNNLHCTDRSLSLGGEITKAIISVSLSSCIVSAVLFFAKYKFFPRSLFLESFVLLCFFLVSFRVIKRLILRQLIKRGFHNINVLIVGANNLGELVLNQIEKLPWWGFKVVGFIDPKIISPIKGVKVVGGLKDFSKIVKELFVDEVMIALPVYDKAVIHLIAQAKKMKLGVKVIPKNIEESMPQISTSYLGTVPLLTFKERHHYPVEFFIKRTFDFLSALVILLFLMPIMAVIALLIKIDSPGPAFFVQERVGYKGKIFKCLKFRSMVENAEKLRTELSSRNEVKGGIIFKIKDDPRITKFGKILRKFSLDELPQIINVLKGEMSFVGPRPPIVDEVNSYNHDQMQRLSVRPGLTGLTQVKGRSELTFKKWVRWDLWYINNWSFALDLQIILWTIPVVLKGKGAY
ncbi:MAG: sugar transferase [Candidatus Omnitrophica bacterium]|nr:sugar transferase [Candidatus Omnitrophota bacterium]